VWHTGEEQGLWGSRYFTSHPTVPLDRIVAQLNIDMIGRGRQRGEPAGEELALTDMDSLYVVGSRRTSPALGTLIAQVNAEYLGLHYDYSLDEAGNPGRIYERSDHYEYARRGIPIAFFFTGVHQDYHGVNDEIDRIDFPKLRRIVQTIYATARAIADDRSIVTLSRPRP
jgi:Zn-dependent M28 family amino/carboxypeptidase